MTVQQNTTRSRRGCRRSSPRFRKACRSRFCSHVPGFQAPRKSPRTCLEGSFGEVIRATGPMAKANPFRFSTKYQDDESDLLYYGYRYYNANTGRWNSRDPVADFAFLKSRKPTITISFLRPLSLASKAANEIDVLQGNPYAFVLNEPIAYADYAGPWVVCCRSGNPEPDDPSLAKCILPFITHCQLEKSACPEGKDADGTPWKWTAYPVTKSNTGKMDNGKCCSSVTDQEIRDCVDKRWPYSPQPLPGPSGPGNNCQTSVIQSLGNCCLKSTWKPCWYAGDPNGVCVRGHYVTSPTTGVPIWTCDEYKPYPINQPCGK